MADVLVTGGTGILGRRLAPRLLSRGHRVRLLSRHPGRAAEGTGAGASAGTEAARGDVRTGEGLRAAFAGIDTVIHAATNSRARTRSTEVEGTRNVLEQAKASDAHLIYISIVGVDRHRLPYYRAKWEAERLIASSSAGWTIQRATQFHPLLDMLLGLPAFISTPNLAFQTVDAGEVSDRLADLVEAGPSGRIPDFGGPEILGIGRLAETRRELTGRRARLIRVPRLGALRDFDRGRHLAPGHRDGRITWEQWLASAGT